jgi:hypothetical protein
MKVQDFLKTVVGTIAIIAILAIIGFANIAATDTEKSSAGCGGNQTDCDGNKIDEHGYTIPPKDPVEDTPANVQGHTSTTGGTAASVDPNTIQSETKSSAQGGMIGSGGGGGGSCPYLYTWNGTSYVLDNDIIPFKHPSLENNDFYTIQQTLKPEEGYYKVKIAEELPETSYLDSVRLVTIDHPSAVEVYPDLKGKMFNISNPKPLLSCIDSHGNDCLNMLKGREEVYTPGSYFQGVQGEYIIADFGNLSGQQITKLVVTSDGPVETGPAPSLNPSSGKSIRIDSLVTENGIPNWVTRFVFTPHELWATNVFDITDLVTEATGEFKLRFYFTNTHKIDFIGIDTTPEIEKEVHEFTPVYAKAGEDALSQVGNTDGNYLVMKKGDELFLKFFYQPPEGKINFKRDFIFISRGYYIPDQK